MINVFGSLVGKEELEEVRTSLDAQWMGIGPKTAASLLNKYGTLEKLLADGRLTAQAEELRALRERR